MKINPALQVHIQSTRAEINAYLFIVYNVSNREVRNISFSFYDLLGPGDFGLDDTHMTKSLTDENDFVLASLKPGESAAVALTKWGPIDEYKGSFIRTVVGRFADGSQLNGHTLNHEVLVLIFLPNNQCQIHIDEMI